MKPYAVFLLGAVVFMAGCGWREIPVNQRQQSVSPGGQYVVEVPIEKLEDGHRYWIPVIKGVDSEEIIYKDSQKEFIANVHIYWMWDVEDRLWMYSTDTGRVYVVIPKDDSWEKIFWGYAKDRRRYKEPINPPDGLFPELNT